MTRASTDPPSRARTTSGQEGKGTIWLCFSLARAARSLVAPRVTPTLRPRRSMSRWIPVSRRVTTIWPLEK